MFKSKIKEILLTIPSLGWIFFFFLVPTWIILLYSFKPADIYGGILNGWSFETLKNLQNPYFFKLIARTMWISSLSTALCILLALPTGYQIATSRPKWRHVMLMMIIIPFWSSFLIRIFAWKTILHPEGHFHQTLVMMGIISQSTPLLYTNFSVVLVMVYTFLPFALLPIYTAAIRFDFQLIEAAMDLGATRLKAIKEIFIPGIKNGILTAAMMVFIPAFGTYVIPDLVGGMNSDMIGNKIAQKIFSERNIPESSAISMVLALLIFIPVVSLALYSKTSRRLETSSRSKE